MRVSCIKCGRIGNLATKKTKTRDTYYEYYYVQHYVKATGKIKWCYLGSLEKLPDQYKELLNKEIHNTVHKRQET